MTMTDMPDDDGSGTRQVPFISRVRIKNYKSIADCDVNLGPLTVLIGPNGSGKSNFLDALAFLARALKTTPTEAVNERGGLSEILRRIPEPAESFSIAVTVKVPWEPSAHLPGDADYELEIRPPSLSGIDSLEVSREDCVLRHDGGTSQFHAKRGDVEIDAAGFSRSHSVSPDRLFLSTSGTPPFMALYDGLQRMQFYSFNVETLRTPQRLRPRDPLGRHGEHLGDVLTALATDSPGYKRRIDAYMRAIVQDVTTIEPYSIGGYMTVALKTAADGHEAEFGPQSMSDGTIRAAAFLTALFQPTALDGRLPLIGIEEPEIALHPAVAGVLFDALTEASMHVQIVAVSQSADLLDRDDLDVSVVRPVAIHDGVTIIGEVDDPSREVTEKKLFTLGELMRSNQLTPRPAPATDSAPEEV